MPSSLAQLELGVLPGLICHKTTVHGPGEPTVLWDLGFFMYKTTGTQLSQHIVIFLSVKFPYSTMKEPSIPNYHFIFLKSPISGWAVSAKYLALSYFIVFPPRARRAHCQGKQPSHFKDEMRSPAILSRSRSQRAAWQRAAPGLLAPAALSPVTPILVLIHAKTQPKPQQILFTFRW